MKTKTICMFCMKSKCKRVLCRYKGKVMSAYAKKFGKRDFWKLMYAIENGMIDLDGEAHRLMVAVRKQA
jgi:hypothetical protein